MLKRAIVAIGIVLFTASMVNAAGIAVSAYSGEQHIALRAGLEVTDDLELGIQGEGTTLNNFWEQDCTLEDTLIGGYADLKIDIGDNWNIDPVIGGQFGYGLDTQGWQVGPEAGIRFNIHSNIAASALVQYRWQDGDLQDKYDGGVTWLLGARVRF